MPRIAYVDGAYLPLRNARVSVEDRGYQFADGVYEVCCYHDGCFWDLDGHLARLWRSLDALEIARPMSEDALRVVMARLIRANRLKAALLYIQVTRGAAPRGHAFPDAARPIVVMTVRPAPALKSDHEAVPGVAAISTDDIRWGRVDIKSVSLLPNVLAKEAARRAGAFEAILIKDGLVTEGSSTNVWMVDQDGVLVTRGLSDEILAGVTRAAVMRCAQERQISVVERAFTVDDLHNAREIFLTSATGPLTPVIRLDGKTIGAGCPGPVTLQLRSDYIAAATGRGGNEA